MLHSTNFFYFTLWFLFLKKKKMFIFPSSEWDVFLFSADTQGTSQTVQLCYAIRVSPETNERGPCAPALSLLSVGQAVTDWCLHLITGLVFLKGAQIFLHHSLHDGWLPYLQSHIWVKFINIFSGIQKNVIPGNYFLTVTTIIISKVYLLCRR